MTDPAPPATVLFVDDEANILAALKRLFRTHNHRILTAGSDAFAAIGLPAALAAGMVFAENPTHRDGYWLADLEERERRPLRLHIRAEPMPPGPGRRL